MIILENLSTRQDTGFIASQIMQVLSYPFTISEYALRVSASFGCSFYPLDGAEEEILLKAADVRMYENKRTGHPEVGGCI